jgi:hypothetical protein
MPSRVTGLPLSTASGIPLHQTESPDSNGYRDTVEAIAAFYGYRP